MSITVDFPEAEWQAMIKAGHEAVKRSFELYVTDFWGNLREEAPVDQGRLSGAFQMSKLSDFSYRIVNGVEYAMAVWKGTAPHVIVPVNAKALFWPGADHPVMRVNHPGTKPNDFVERSLARSDGRTDDFVFAALSQYGLT